MAEQSDRTETLRDATEPGSAPAGPAPLRVAWIASEHTQAVCGDVLDALAEGLAAERIDLTWVLPERTATPSSATEAKHARFRLRRPWGLWGSELLRVAELLRREKISILHALEPRAAVMIRRLLSETGLPYVVGSFSLQDARVIGRLPVAPARVLAGSEPIRHPLSESGTVAEDAVCVVRPGVRCAPCPRCFDEPDRKPSLVVGGSMDRPARVEAVLRTLAELRDRQYGCACLVAGTGPAVRAIRRRAVELALMRDLTFAEGGESGPFADVVRAGDIYISSSAPPGLDVQCLQAMAAGCAVITPESPASDFIIDGRTALQFEPGSMADLTVKLASLLDDRAAARALAGRALEHVTGRHSVAAAASETARVYRSVLAQSG